MISPAQNRFYWSLWAKAKRELLKRFNSSTLQPFNESAARHELHIRAIGHDKSHYDLTNRELDLVIAEMRRVADPDRFNASSVQRFNGAEATRRRMYFGLRGAMRRLRLEESYVNAISRKMFLGLEINDLQTDELHKLLKSLKIYERRGVIAEPPAAA